MGTQGVMQSGVRLYKLSVDRRDNVIFALSHIVTPDGAHLHLHTQYSRSKWQTNKCP